MDKEKVEKYSLFSISIASMVVGYVFLSSTKQMIQHIGQILFLMGLMLLLWKKG